MAGLLRGRPEYSFRHAGTLAPPPGFDALVEVGVGPDGPVAIWAAATDREQTHGRHGGPDGGMFADTRTASAPRVALARYTVCGTLEAVTQTGLRVAHPMVQPLPDGCFLVVGARCAWRESGPERNAFVVAPDGSTARAGTFGDGIQHLLVDDAGDVWAGYFDEGIFGNHGWGAPGPRPLGSAGIVHWSAHFETLWELPATEGVLVADCYALNVGRDRVWACTYTDFPVLTIEAGTVSVGATDGVSGPAGLVVGDRTLAVIGAYGSPGTLLVGPVDEPRRLRKATLTMPGGRSVPGGGTLVCRGSVAHLFVGPDWFTYDLAEP